MVPGDWKLGPIGFAYDQWHGSFFPKGLSKESRLQHAASIYSLIEMDTSFYAIPPPAQVRKWARDAPSEFEFIFKAPHQLTHETQAGGLADSASRGLWRQFADSVCEAGMGRTWVLLQLPPSFGPDRREELADFIGHMEPDLHSRVFAEFRQPRWHQGPAQQLGVPTVAADLAGFGEAASAPPPSSDHPYAIVDNGGPLYLRLCGRHGQYERDDVELFDSTPRLEWWLARLRPHLAPGRRVLATVGNSYCGHAPAGLARLASLLGISLASGLQPRLDFLDSP